MFIINKEWLAEGEGKDHLVIKAEVETTREGRYKLMLVAYASDGLTDKVFVKREGPFGDVYFVREIDDNNVYKDYPTVEAKKPTDTYIKEFEQYDELKKHLEEIVKTVEEYRKKVREKVKREVFHIII